MIAMLMFIGVFIIRNSFTITITITISISVTVTIIRSFGIRVGFWVVPCIKHAMSERAVNKDSQSVRARLLRQPFFSEQVFLDFLSLKPKPENLKFKPGT